VASALDPTRTGNFFLDALTNGSRTRLLPHLENVAMNNGDPVGESGKPIASLSFPLDALLSTVATMRDGAMVEVTVTGREGFYGLPAVFGDDQSLNEAMVQSSGAVLRMRSERFIEMLRDDPELNARTLRYAQSVFVAISQFAACNRLHPVNERCARWLLMAHDRVVGDEMLLTHEYLAKMLGVRRPAVTLAAASLERDGLIEYGRGRIVVLDRFRLQAAACECYAVINDECTRLLGYDVRKVSGDGESGVTGCATPAVHGARRPGPYLPSRWKLRYSSASRSGRL